MEKNLRLFDKSRIYMKLNNSGVHSSFVRSECTLVLRISRETTVEASRRWFMKLLLKQAEDGCVRANLIIVIRMIPATTEKCGGGWHMCS